MSNISIYECQDGRCRVYLRDTKQVVSYPRYLIEQTLGRKLKDNEQVHHKDGNPLNNNIDNLEIRLLGEHQREHSKKYFDKITACEWCNTDFLWTAKQQSMFYRNQKRRNFFTEKPFCSKKCAGQYGKFVQMANNL